MYVSCKPTNLHEAEKELNLCLKSIETLGDDHSLAISTVKLKYMICASKQLHQRNKLNEKSISLQLGNESLSCDDISRPRGVHLDKNLDWSGHLQNLLTSCYRKIAMLRILKKFTTFIHRKQLIRVPDFIENRLQ